MEIAKSKNEPELKTDKEHELRVWMQSQSSVLVAFSGGVDSSYLAFIATQELGENALCVTGVSPSVSKHQIELAKAFAANHNLNHRLMRTDEMEVEGYIKNAGNRCFFCKTELYTRLNKIAKNDDKSMTVIDGTNADDLGDFRPGMKAASDLGVVSPLADLGFTKPEIRSFGRRLGLETAELPSSPCLSSRVAIGVEVTADVLGKIESGEEILRAQGFREFRLRVHGQIARIEIAQSEMSKEYFFQHIKEVTGKIKEIGFEFVTLDLDGFRSGSLNPVDLPPVAIEGINR